MFDALKTLVFGGKPAKERRHMPRVGKPPAINAYIAKQQTAMKITAPVTQELWDWLILMGWREIEIKSNRRKIRRLDDRVFSKLAQANQQDREAIYREILSK
ncbi:hypothetical protein [Methyloradius palustris]|uniref:Uncharacterized protein n=1 Tax=Methyloradius palustris TaxID=2778876 RepID=A0A8D5K0C8_9PROT|nr:hypothetical protein [Methyloradius palustris]BCM24628.1 hypothetical protein ZMTM_08870 [Methyloradius palustris]